MFENYKATKKDFQAIEEGIRTVWRPELNFVFKDKKSIKKTIIISYDSKNIYLWSTKKFAHLAPIECHFKQYFAYKIPHRLSIPKQYHWFWRKSVEPEKLISLLPISIKGSSIFTIPKISGGLLIPFITLQKQHKVADNPYTTRESFLATIVHEFAHVYWDKGKLWWYSNKKKNLRYLTTAIRLYKHQEKSIKISLRFPVAAGVSELFAFCTEYEVSSLFWPFHKQKLDIFISRWLKKLVNEERKKNLDCEDSVLEPNRDPHTLAFVFGKIILTRYPKIWPQILTQFKKISLIL